MAYGMSAAKEAGLAQTQVWKRLMGMPVDQLKAAAHGEVPGVDMNLATLALRAKMTQVADKGAQAQQQLAQAGQGSVKARMLAQADQLPEMLGIGRLPAQNMEEMAAAQGGVVGYASGGEVERYAEQGLVLPEGYEMFEDPTSGEVYPRKKRAGLYDYGLSLQEKARGVRPPAPVAPMSAATPAAAPAAPAANAAANVLNDAPKKLKKDAIDLTQPKVPVADPTKQQTENVEDQIGKLDKWTTYLDKKYGDLMNPIKEQLQRDRDEYANMKSENVGLALLGAAGALLKPGRTTASAIGEGLSTLGEYGMRFQPQMLAARQGISAGEIGLANAQAQATRGNFATAAQLQNQEENRALKLRELASQEQYQRDVGSYYRARAADTGAGGGMNQKLYAQTYNNANKAWEKFVAGKGGSLYKPKPGEQEAFIKNYMQQSLPSLNLAGASSGYTGGPNIIRGGKPDPEDLMG